MDEAQVIERMALIADDQTAEVAQPGEEPLNLPTALVPSQWTAILGLGAFPVPTVRGNHLDAELGQRVVERISVVGAVANQALGQLGYEAGVEGGSDEGDLMRRSRGGTDGERKTSTVCQIGRAHV